MARQTGLSLLPLCFPWPWPAALMRLPQGLPLLFLPSVNIWVAVLLIGSTTFFLSAFGLKAGGVVGRKQSALAERLGGIILIGIGTKILIEHLFF